MCSSGPPLGLCLGGHLQDPSRIDARLASAARPVGGDRASATLRKALDCQPSRNLVITDPFGHQQNEACTPHYPSIHRLRSRTTFQLGAFF